jgi:hypothetical protein
MIDLAAAHHRHEAPAALLDRTGFAASRGIVRRFRVYGQPFLFQCSDDPLFKRLV